MKFQDAARIQRRLNSFYTVWLVSPTGERERLGSSQRKTGTGLMAVVRSEFAQERLKKIPGIHDATFTKHGDRLELSNGWKVVFGGTIRQEAERE